MRPKKPTLESLAKVPDIRSNRPRQQRKGRPRIEEKDDKRSLIIRATRTLLRQHKPANITRKSIAATAGVDPALVSYYFGDQAALFREVVWQITGELHEKLTVVRNTPSTAIDGLRARLKIWFEVFVSNPHYGELVVENVYYGDKQEASEMLKIFVQRALPDLEKLVSDGIDNGEIRAVEPRFVYVTLIALAEHYATAGPLVAELFGSKDAGAKQADAYCDYAAEMMIDGLRFRSKTSSSKR